jgi:hypothetical protein
MKNDFSLNWREFHDSLLDYGQDPPALIGSELKEMLTRSAGSGAVQERADGGR